MLPTFVAIGRPIIIIIIRFVDKVHNDKKYTQAHYEKIKIIKNYNKPWRVLVDFDWENTGMQRRR